MRDVVASLAVTSTYPLPAASFFVDTAPALPRPWGAVWVRLLPETHTPTADVHATGCGGGGVPDGSSLRMVPWACPRAIVALSGLVRFTKNVSFGSATVSPTMATAT